MAAYVVGDIQGCYDSLIRLLQKARFDWSKDKLWLCGDLVNRGPKSLQTLRYLFQHRERIKLVLGNHDLHLLAVAQGAAKLKRKDTLQPILDAPDAAELLDWLCHQPLAYYNQKHQTLLVHAGVLPSWSLPQALSLAQEVSQTLQDPIQRASYFNAMYGNTPEYWQEDLAGLDRLRFITNVFTRMRFVAPDGKLDMLCKLGPGKQPEPLKPWFHYEMNLPTSTTVLFGHWAALEGKVSSTRFQALDTGCVWGGKLTALKLKSARRITVKACDGSQ